VALLQEAAPEQGGHLELVLDDERAHLRILVAKMRAG